ncbi:MAG: hypothetical protein ABS95_00830 [Verrucomicrobia bacterium SCN 57-15]|nr:MAG: hypothetical protein ABS95_00830 [Verrucomicrobia bacterium SCN 57-15]
MSNGNPLTQVSRPPEKFASCLQAVLECKKICDECNHAIIASSDVKALFRCFTLNRDCALFCNSTSLLLEHGSEFLQPLLLLCGHACAVCAEEAARHSMPECQRAALACRRCAEECEKLTGQFNELVTNYNSAVSELKQ